MLLNCDKHLFSAIELNDAKAVQQALQDGANVNAVSPYSGRRQSISPLTRASERGHDQIVRILLDADADVKWEDPTGVTAVSLACAGGHFAVVQMLIHHDRTLLECGWPPLHTACLKGHTEICRFLVDQGCNVNAISRNGSIALIAAAVNGHLAVVRLLLASGANVDACGQNKHTAIHFAAMHGHVDVMHELILHNATIYPKFSVSTYDPIWEKKGMNMDLLVQMYSNRFALGEKGRLALHALLHNVEYDPHEGIEGEDFNPSHGCYDVSLQMGSIPWKEWRTLLLSFDEELLSYRDDGGNSPIHIACQTNAPVDVLAMLVERAPATLHMVDHVGDLPLHKFCGYGCRSNDTAISLDFLVKRGGVGTLAARNRDGAMPLHVLCGATVYSPPWRMVRYLIHHFPGAVETQTYAGQYPFMIAAANNALLSTVYVIVRANPLAAVPRTCFPPLGTTG